MNYFLLVIVVHIFFIIVIKDKRDWFCLLKKSTKGECVCRHIFMVHYVCRLVYVCLHIHRKYDFILQFGRTEVIWNNLNPDFVKKFIIHFYFEQAQKLKFEVWGILFQIVGFFVFVFFKTPFHLIATLPCSMYTLWFSHFLFFISYVSLWGCLNRCR